MRSDMQFAGCGTIPAELVFPGFAADKEKALGKKSAECSDLFVNVRRHLVGNCQNQILFGFLDLLFATNLQYRRACAATHSLRINEVICAVVQGVKWNVVQNMMRNKNQRRSSDLVLDRLDQMTMELPKMILNGPQEHRPVRFQVCGLEMKLRELKCKALQRCPYCAGCR